MLREGFSKPGYDFVSRFRSNFQCTHWLGVVQMNNTLIQQDFLFNRKQFTITTEGIHVKSRRFLNNNEYFLNFEDIGLKAIKKRQGKLGWLVGIIAFVMLAFVVLVAQLRGADVEPEAFGVYLGIAAIFTAGYLVTYERLCYLTNNDNSNSVIFLLDNPNQTVFESFLTDLKTARKTYLLRKYRSFSRLLSFEQQYNQLQWLYSTSTISTAEYEASLSELNNLFNTTGTIRGFQSSR